MRWDFWKTEPSLQLLDPHLLAFTMVQNISKRKFPFNRWRDEGSQIPEYADAFVEVGVNVYQLSILLDFLERKFGIELSEIVKAHLIPLLSKGKHAGTIRNFFEAVVRGRILPDREEHFDGKPLFQTDCNVAKVFLGIVAESAEEKTKLYPLLGQSLTLGRISAEAAFGGLVEQIEFRPETIIGLCKPEKSCIVWSEACGAFERQLQRRHNSPLFAQQRRQVITAELLWARSQDLHDLISLQEDFQRFLERNFDDGKPTASFGEVLETREEVEKLIIQAAGIGDLANGQRQKLRMLYDTIVESLRNACPADTRTNLESALANSEGFIRKFANNFVAQVNRKNSPILPDDLVASLLTEGADTVRLMASFVRPDERVGMRRVAASLIENARKEGHMVSEADEKLKAFFQTPTSS